MGRASVFLGFLVVARTALLGRMHMGLQVDARFYRGCESGSRSGSSPDGMDTMAE